MCPECVHASDSKSTSSMIFQLGENIVITHHAGNGESQRELYFCEVAGCYGAGTATTSSPSESIC